MLLSCFFFEFEVITSYAFDTTSLPLEFLDGRAEFLQIGDVAGLHVLLQFGLNVLHTIEELPFVDARNFEDAQQHLFQ